MTDRYPHQPPRLRILPKNGRVFALTPPDILDAARAYVEACDRIGAGGNATAQLRKNYLKAKAACNRLARILPRQPGYHPVGDRLVGYRKPRVGDEMMIDVRPGVSDVLTPPPLAARPEGEELSDG